MNRHLAIIAAGLSLIAGRSFASEPQAPPPAIEQSSPTWASDHEPLNSIFVGHYGEVIEVPYGWTVEAEMHSETEAIFLHRKYQDDFGHPFILFKPKKSDYRPENFTPLGLMQLIVIPKNAPGGLRSLKAIRAAKEVDLKQTGVEYEISTETEGRDWPLTTFHVNVNKPYKLWQTYAESPGEFYILSTGLSLEPGDDGYTDDRSLSYKSALQDMDRSLGDYLRRVHKRTFAEHLFRFKTSRPADFLSDFISMIEMRIGNPRWLHKAVGALGALATVLALWPGATPRARRVRFFGRNMLSFAILTALAGFLVVFLPYSLCDASWKSNEIPLAIPVLFIPGACWAAARAFGSARPLKVLALTGIVAAAWLVEFLRGADLKNLSDAVVVAFVNTHHLFIVGTTAAIAYCIGFGPLPNSEESR